MNKADEIQAFNRGELGYTLLGGEWLPHPILKPKPISGADLPTGCYRVYPADQFTAEQALAQFLLETGLTPLIIYAITREDTSVVYWVSADPDVVRKQQYKEKYK